jgi:3-isopropylmalate/(R)-2-methylmalate dehydratase small subunit
VLNRPEHAGARILLGGPNFGTGSSREHAVWALLDYGFQAVVSPRFADIFRNNCTKSGLLPVEVDAATMDGLLSAVATDPGVEVDIDVEARRITVPATGLSAPFPLDEFTRIRFLEGLDDIALTLRHADAITGHEAGRPPWLPTTSAG